MNTFYFLLFIAVVMFLLIRLNEKHEESLQDFRVHLNPGTKVRFCLEEESMRGMVVTRIDNHVVIQDELGELYQVDISNIYPLWI